jgi:copper chaperone
MDLTTGEGGMKHQVINVNGMSCDHCVQSITKALRDVNGVASVKIDLEKKVVAVDFEEDQTDLKTISNKITEVGFEVA